MSLQAVFFDQDGVIIDTERDGHRVAFNRAFKEAGVDAEWGVEQYRRLLQTGGGKERIAAYFTSVHFSDPRYLEDPDGFIRQLHKRKTEIFIELIERGTLPLRPGVLRLMREINQAGIFFGICTTSNEKAARAIADSALAGITIDLLLAGDVVGKKKPDPEIYLLALEQSGAPAENCFVVEDSRIGVAAAKAAGMRVVATVNPYTAEEDVSAADIVVDCLGEPEGPASRILSKVTPAGFAGVIDLRVLRNVPGS